jgi:hypothetical protein
LREADFENNLVMRHLGAFDVAALSQRPRTSRLGRSVREARPTAFWIASSIFVWEEPATSMIR